MRSIIIIALGLIAVPAVAADQFDLICTDDKGSPSRYRVDLSTGEACSGECDRIWKMGGATAGEIKLIDRTPSYKGDLEERMVVSRQTGEMRYLMLLNGHMSAKDGKCEPATFSGFPKAKF